MFIATGGVAALVNFFSRILYDIWLSFSAAIVLAYVSGMITAFVLAKLFVFKHGQQSLHKSALFFTLVNLFAVLQTWAVSMFLYHYGLSYLDVKAFKSEISHAVGVLLPVFTSFLGHKYLSFR